MAGRQQAPILQALVLLCIVALVSCNDHYRVLGVSPTASNAEIKKVCLIRHVTPFVVLVSGTRGVPPPSPPSSRHSITCTICIVQGWLVSRLPWVSCALE
jgi:hypothetical protein